MTPEQERCIADALDKRSREDRLFAYILLIVVTFVVGIGGYNLSKLTTSLSDNMQSIALDLKSMRNEMVTISSNVVLMEGSMDTMAADLQKASKTLDGMANSVDFIEKNINNMHEDMETMNKINPFRHL